MKKQRTRMRGFDIYQFVAFGNIPNIKNLEAYYDGHNRFDVQIMHTKTGEVVQHWCSTPDDCTALAKSVNKILKNYEEWENKHAGH